MDWSASNRFDSFEYWRVDRQTMQDKALIDNIQDGGSIEYNDLTSLKVSGNVPYVGSLDIGNDYLRIYSISYLDDETVKMAHGTFIVSMPTNTMTGRKGHVGQATEGKADLYSLLQTLMWRVIGEPLTVVAGTVAITYAANLVSAVGLPVVAETSTKQLANPMTFDSGTTWLEIINELCAFAGFDSAEVDSMGNVRLVPYINPANLSPAITLTDGENSVFEPMVSYEQDIYDVPNRVTVVLSDDDTTSTATAINDSPDNPYSTVSRGRIIDFVDDISNSDAPANLQERAMQILQQKTSAVESIELSHVYQPYNTGQAVRLIYKAHDFDFIGIAVKKSIKLSPGMLTNARFRRFVRF